MSKEVKKNIMICAIAIAIVGGIATLAKYPRAITIEGAQPPTSARAENSTRISPVATVDAAAYDTKLLQIANLSMVTRVTTIKGTSSTPTTTEITTSTIPMGWPVRAPRPKSGALLPFNRIVAYYGNLYSTQMGVLGEYPEAQMLDMLASTTAGWQAADTSTPVIPALDYIAVSAQGTAGSDGKYRARMPADQINRVIQMAAKINGVVFLDVQVGLSDVATEIPLLEQYLKLPQVHLALDPEFAMHNGEKPGNAIGTLDASDINFAANYLADLVQKNDLPPKILVIHRFTEPMVTNAEKITPLPEVQIVMDMDGFGAPAQKHTTYLDFIQGEPVQFTGFKLFYKNDTRAGHLMTPTEVMKLSPEPSFIQYQ